MNQMWEKEAKTNDNIYLKAYHFDTDIIKMIDFIESYNFSIY
ncbi:hypothetical protein KL86DYS2_10573 [uncultured Dysgonomonas sp.]|uniref:Uncharacterized protein n=1 Tax=uncultured Dysgonomonas sp. TaxID=206096 RepID=A0A212J2C0_9BACT|nr:hypothetical protein KL86DYS2_10573 [uncultured Dysgonomonas sp.]